MACSITKTLIMNDLQPKEKSLLERIEALEKQVKELKERIEKDYVPDPINVITPWPLRAIGRRA